ncbi:MAG: diacylglycerol kinase family protein [Thermoguttaceae bacterium]|nr:diacylglycerol kinase family protein [Thermoguttaceae bacterium]
MPIEEPIEEPKEQLREKPIEEQLEPDTLSRPKFIPQKRTWRAKFRDAFHGLSQSFHRQSSYRVHFTFAIAAVAAGILVGLSALEWALLVFAIGFVIAAEMFNTALEVMAREITDEQSEYIRLSLDISSGAVFVASLVAVITGVILFGRPMLTLFEYMYGLIGQ